MKTNISNENKMIRNDNLEQHVISSNKKTTYTLEAGKNATTLKPGILYPIMIKEVLAGEYIENWKLTNITRLITPMVPNMDKVYINISAYFVPHTRVWKDAESVLARQNNTILSLPTTLLNTADTTYSTYNRQIISRYGIPNKAAQTNINILPIRGYRAIVNDFILNKDYGTKKIEWNESIPTQTEKNNIIGYQTNSINLISGVTANTNYQLETAPTRKGYLTNIKKQMALIEDSEVLTDFDDKYNHLDWQTRFQREKQSELNRNKNDWDIIAEMGGTQPVTTDRVNFLGEVDYEMNFQQITQTAPEIDNSSPLGTTGSFSFTKANGNLFSHKKFLQHGFIHILISVSIDNYYETATPKELLKKHIDEIYTPALAKKEIQMLQKQEISNSSTNSGSAAFQPAWAEYKRLPSWASGQMQSETLTKVTADLNYTAITNAHWHNMQPKRNITIDDNYFRNNGNINNVFGRNNILGLDYYNPWPIEPMINLSEHIVTTQLPINENALKGTDKAEKAR